MGKLYRPRHPGSCPGAPRLPGDLQGEESRRHLDSIPEIFSFRGESGVRGMDVDHREEHRPQVECDVGPVETSDHLDLAEQLPAAVGPGPGGGVQGECEWSS